MIGRKILSFALCASALFTIVACAPKPTAESPPTTASNSPAPSDTPAVPAETPDEPGGDALFPQISTTTLAGDTVTGDEFKGDVLTVLNIWATWCPPCVKELPHLQEVSAEYAEQGVKIVGVMQDGVTDRLESVASVIEVGKTLLADAEAEYTVILPDAVIMRTFIQNMQYFPTTFFLDADGNVLETIIGSKDAKGWRAEINAVLEELA